MSWGTTGGPNRQKTEFSDTRKVPVMSDTYKVQVCIGSWDQLETMCPVLVML